MRRTWRFVLALALAASACEPAVVVEPAPAQVVVHLDTDAPVPSSSKRVTGPLEPAPLFDRVRIEVFEPGASAPCAGCINDFPLDGDLLRERRASFGIAPRAGVSGYRVRVRMFFNAFAGSSGVPDDANAIVEKVVDLPVVGPRERADVTVRLLVDDVGVPVGTLEQPAAPDERAAPVGSSVGTWPLAARIDCTTSADPDEVCIPGGAIWIGEIGAVHELLPFHDVHRPRLVVLSPFFIDAHEVTVGDIRRDGDAIASIFPTTGSKTGEQLIDYCTFTRAPGENEDHPAVCLSFLAARAYCSRRGKVLPSETQYEYVASGLRGDRFVWGNDSPACSEATYSRIGWGIYALSVAQCRPPTPPGGPLPVGSGSRDRLVMPTGTVVDLAANAAEWVRDVWNRFDEPCWSTPGILFDPVCREKGADGSRQSVRGGSWVVSTGQLAHTIRAATPPTSFSAEIGFRCARAD